MTGKQFLTVMIMFLSATDAFACRQTALARSKSLIDAVVADVVKTYPLTGGGGISEIQLVATDVIRVSISQEERIDEMTYHLTTRPSCEVSIVKRVDRLHSLRASSEHSPCCARSASTKGS